MLLNEKYIVDKEIEYLLSCYKKLKYHYYYNKGNVNIREKITLFEKDKDKFYETFNNLNDYIKEPNNPINYKYINSLIENIDFFVLPKSFAECKVTDLTSNLKKSKIEKVNFFIDMPIELFILDTYWTILLANLDREKKYLNHSLFYGNTIKSELFSDGKKGFNNNRYLFENYYTKYTQWKINSYNHIQENFDNNKSTLFIKFDIKDYYYNVRFDFNFNRYFQDYNTHYEIHFLSDLFKTVFLNYFNKIKKFRNDLNDFTDNNLPLPLGLFSSMFISNLYLSNIDNQFQNKKNIHYGRYVDDFLICIDKEFSSNEIGLFSKKRILNELGIIKSINNMEIKSHEKILINEDKIEVLYFDRKGSRNLLEKYFETLKSMPSDIAFSSMDNISIEDTTLPVDNFEIESSLDILNIKNINKYKIIRFFNLLKNQNMKFSNNNSESFDDDYIKDINKIDLYFKNGQIIENYSNWQNYLYFLVLCNDSKKIYTFYKEVEEQLHFIDDSTFYYYYKHVSELTERLQKSMITYLKITLNFALSINIKNTNILIDEISDKSKIQAIYASNMFDNKLVEIPLFNFLNHQNRHDYKDIKIKDYFDLDNNVINQFKFYFSPRFIHFNEIQFLKSLLDLLKLNSSKINIRKLYNQVNHLDFHDFYINDDFDFEFQSPYSLSKIKLNGINNKNLDSVKIAVVNIDLDINNINDLIGNWSYSENKKKYDIFQKVLHESICDLNNKADILVFPELYLPFTWIDDLVLFSKKHNVAIFAGLKYVESLYNLNHNLILSLYPVMESEESSYQVYLDIREKNDYSYIEKYDDLFSNNHMWFLDSEISKYRVFEWNNIKISSLLCFEVTDIICRSLHKNNVDFLIMSEANKDTNYFSEIVGSTARDLHSVIIQSNIACYGDSKITGPFKTEVKDRVIIKGGLNANVVIGEINLSKIKEFQKEFKLMNTSFIKTISITDPNFKFIKKPSARFTNVNDSIEES